MTNCLRLLLFALVLSAVPAAEAATYRSASATFNFISSATHTRITTWPGCSDTSGDDSLSAPIDIGFSFSFGGVSYTQVRVMTNGRLQFNNTTCGYGTQSVGPPRTYPYGLPDASLDRTIKIYGADLDVSSGGGGTVTYGQAGTAPNRAFIVTWNNVSAWKAGGATNYGNGTSYNLQIQLYENGEFYFMYGVSDDISEPSNSAVGAADYGWQLSTTDYVRVGTGLPANNSGLRFYAPSTLVEYRMEESSWTGAANEVRDSTSNGYHAQSFGSASTRNTTPAVPGSPGTCRYGQFDGSTGYLRLPSTFPNLTGSFTVMAWIRPGRISGDQRILVDDDNSSSGYALSLGDGGSGRLRFFSRAVSPVILDTASAVVNVNQWTFVAAVHNVINKTRRIYVNGSFVPLSTGGTTSTYTGTWGTDSGRSGIGGETSGSETTPTFRFNGNIDELRVVSTALEAADLSAEMAVTRPCAASVVARFALSHDGAGSTCQPEPVTVTALDASNATVTDYVGTIRLTVSSAHGDWSLGTATGTLANGTADDGAASYTFSGSGTGADNGVARLNLTNSHADTLTITAVDQTLPATSSTSGALTFSDNGFTVMSTDALGSTVVAGRGHGMQVQMVRRDPVTGSCGVETGYTGAKSLDAWVNRDAADPGGTAPSIGGVALPNAAPGGLGADNLSLTFASGVASFTLATSDVGKYALNLRDDSRSYANAVDISGASATLTVRPFGLDVFSVRAGATANPGTGSATGTVFTGAGRSFQASVRGVAWQSADDGNNDGVPDAGANLADNATLPRYAWPTTLAAAAPFAPATGVAGTLANGSVAAAAFSAGSATVTTLNYSEVGSFTLAASSTGYLSTAGANLSGSGGTVGRFTPDNFDVALNTPVFRSGCSGAGFTYVGAPFTYRTAPVMTVTARNAQGATTRNYTGSYFRLGNAALTGKAYTAFVGTLDTSLLPATDPVIADAGAGVGTLTFGAGGGLGFLRGAPAAPFDADIALALNVIDLDGVAYAANPARFGSATLGNGIAFDDGNAATANDKALRWGRLRVANAYGSELLPNAPAVAVDYYTGTGFTVNTLDTCTPLSTAFLQLTSAVETKALGQATIAVAPGANSTASVDATPVRAGLSALRFSAPGAGKLGYINYNYDLTAAGLGWLRYDWAGTGGHDQSPTGRVEFGIYPGSDGVIYQREPW